MDIYTDIPTENKRTVSYNNEEKTPSRGRVKANHNVPIGEVRQ